MTDPLNGIEHEWTPGTRKVYEELRAENERLLELEPLHEARFKAAAWDARQAYLRERGDSDELYEGWENAEFALRMREKNEKITALQAEVARLRDFMESGMAARRDAQSGKNDDLARLVDPKIRAVAEKALADAKADPSIVPGENQEWIRGSLGGVEWAIDDHGDISRRVYIYRTLACDNFVFWLQDRLKAEVENGDNIEIVMSW